MNRMIARIWRGWAPAATAEDYQRHYETEVAEHLQQVSGFRSARLLRCHDGDEVRFTSITFFASMDDVRAFAGEDPERAVVEQAARSALNRWDERVTHHEVTVELSRDPPRLPPGRGLLAAVAAVPGESVEAAEEQSRGVATASLHVADARLEAGDTAGTIAIVHVTLSTLDVAAVPRLEMRAALLLEKAMRGDRLHPPTVDPDRRLAPSARRSRGLGQLTADQEDLA